VALLLSLAALFAALVDPPADDVDVGELVYPRQLERRAKVEREVRRLEADDLPRPDDEGAADDADGGPVLPTRLPVLEVPERVNAAIRATAGGDEQTVIRVRDLGATPLAEKMLRCMGEKRRAAGDETPLFERARRDLGVDPLRDVETVAVGDDLMAMGGAFGALKAPAGMKAVPWADGVERFVADDGAFAEGGELLLKVRDHTLLMARDEAAARRAIERIEGREPVGDLVDPGPSHIRSRLSGAVIGGLFGGGLGDPELLGRVAQGADLRVLVDDRISASLDIEAGDGERARELRSAMKAGLTMLRQDAVAKDHPLAEAMLDKARFLDVDGETVKLDVGLPGAFLLELWGCGPDGTLRAASPGAPPPAAAAER
jgi:hypothetical protein